MHSLCIVLATLFSLAFVLMSLKDRCKLSTPLYVNYD